MSESGDAAGDRAAYLSQGYDDRLGIIRVVGRGFWTEEFVDTHFLELGRLVDRVRARSGTVFALVDLSDAPVQSPEVAARIAAQTRRIYRPTDRVAIVVRSSLMKMQIKRSVDLQALEAFLSLNAALTWLTAHGGAARAGTASAQTEQERP